MLLPHAPEPDEMALWPFFNERITDDDLREVASADQGFWPDRLDALRDMLGTGRSVTRDEYLGPMWLEECFGLHSHPSTHTMLRAFCVWQIVRANVRLGHPYLEWPAFGFHQLLTLAEADHNSARSVAAVLGWVGERRHPAGPIPQSLVGLVQSAALTLTKDATDLTEQLEAIDPQFQTDLTKFASTVVQQYGRLQRDGDRSWARGLPPEEAAALLWKSGELPWVMCLDDWNDDGALRDLVIDLFRLMASESALVEERTSWLCRPWLNWNER